MALSSACWFVVLARERSVISTHFALALPARRTRYLWPFQVATGVKCVRGEALCTFDTFGMGIAVMPSSAYLKWVCGACVGALYKFDTVGVGVASAPS